MTDSIDIPHLARLARLSLTEAELSQAGEDLERIIQMVDAMASIDTVGVLPMANPMDAVQRLRDDVVTEEIDRERFQAEAPVASDGYYLVPRVIE